VDVATAGGHDLDVLDLERARRRRCREEQVDRTPVLREQGLDGRDLDQPAVADDPDAVTASLDLLEVVRRQEDRPATGARFGDEREELALHQGIETGRRLVEDEQRLVAHEGRNDGDLLAVAARQLADRDRRVELEPLGELPPRAPLQPPERGQEIELRAGAELTEITGVAPDVGQASVDRRRIAPDVETEDRGPPSGRTEEPEQGPDRRRLAGAVRPQQAEDLALPDAERQLDDTSASTVGLGEVDDLDDVAHRSLLARWQITATVHRQPPVREGPSVTTGRRNPTRKTGAGR
jgi:hypothetical protein